VDFPGPPASHRHRTNGRPRAQQHDRRRPEQGVLYGVVQTQLETFLARARLRGEPVPRFIEQELRAYLRCGVLAFGFLRVHCDDCGQDRLVPFSCKRRGFCPSCGGRRMADTAAHLVDCVLPEVPVRQWVLTLPYPLRYRCAYDARLTSSVLGAFLRALFAELRRRARREWRVPRGPCGAVTFVQRFGSALNLNLHFHTLVLDGVYAGDGQRPTRFLPLPPPSRGEVARVLAGTARRITRVLASRADGDEDALARDEPLLSTLASASLLTRIATGPDAGERWRRLGDRVEPQDTDADPEASRCVPEQGGMSLHADVAVPARDRRRLERLCHYVARPPLASDRLEERPDGRLALRLKTRWRDGTTHILMEPHELLERLVPLIPPPRAHQVRYHGVLAPCASARDCVVPGPRPTPGPAVGGTAATEPSDGTMPAAVGAKASSPRTPTHRCADTSARVESEPSASTAGPVDLEGRASPRLARGHPHGPNRCDPSTDASRPRPRRLAWAELLQRVFEVDALRCPRCGARMRLVAAIEAPDVARKILACLDLPARAPPLVPAPSASGGHFDEFSGDEPAWAFDQTPPDEEGIV
jgi:Putative transposase/Transposase zinc-binding domain